MSDGSSIPIAHEKESTLTISIIPVAEAAAAATPEAAFELYRTEINSHDSSVWRRPS